MQLGDDLVRSETLIGVGGSGEFIIRRAMAADVPQAALVAEAAFRAAFTELLGVDRIASYTASFFAARFVKAVAHGVFTEEGPASVSALATLAPLDASENYSSTDMQQQQPSRLCVAKKRHDAGAVIGFYLVTGSHLDMIFVTPSAQATGVGSALLRHAEQAGVVSLEVFASNQRARSFYHRNGWQPIRFYKRMYAGEERDFVHYEKQRN